MTVMTGQKIIDDWTASLAAIGRKASTLEGYAHSIRTMLAWLTANGYDTDPRTMGAEVAFALKQYPATEATQRTYHRNLAQWASWYGNDAIGKAPILWNRKTETNVKWITADQWRMLMAHAGPSERLVLVLGALMGLRGSEIANLTLEDIGETTIFIRGKGHGDGLVVRQPMVPEVKAEVDKYIRWRAGRDPRSDRLLIWRDNEGRRASDTAANPRICMYVRMRTYAAGYGIDFAPHCLRRLYATMLYRRGVDIMTVSRLMRHASVRTTQMYIQRDREAEYDAVRGLADALGL